MTGYGLMGGENLIFMLVFAALLVFPFWRILPRQGIPSWVALAAMIPIGAIVLLWIVAFSGAGSSDGKDA